MGSSCSFRGWGLSAKHEFVDTLSKSESNTKGERYAKQAATITTAVRGDSEGEGGSKKTRN